jgi:hypothetical protein
MAEQKRKMAVFGTEMEVVDVPIASSREETSEYELADGSSLRVKNVATSILRIENQFTPDGRPIYLVLGAPVVKVHKSKLKPKTKKRKR